MARIIVGILILSFTSSYGVDICTNQDGSISYESATTLGNSIVIVEPRLLVAGRQTFISAGLKGHSSTYDYGQTFCKAMNYNNGEIGITQSANKDLVAVFDYDGELFVVQEGENLLGIRIVTCQK